MDSNPSFTEEGFDDTSNDNISSNVSVAVLTKDIPLCIPVAQNAKSLRLCFRDRLVGNRSQFNCLFCCLACEFSNCLLFIIISDRITFMLRQISFSCLMYAGCGGMLVLIRNPESNKMLDGTMHEKSNLLP